MGGMAALIIRKYTKEDIDLIREISSDLADEILYHGDCTAKDIRVAEINNKAAGAAILLKDLSWRYIDSDEVEAYYLLAECRVNKELDEEVEIYAALIEELQNIADQYRKDYPDKDIFLRMWCRDREIPLMNFLMQMDFEAVGIMHVMEHDLKEISISHTDTIDGIIFRKLDMESEWEKYFEANEKGFGLRDSEAQMRYHLRCSETKVFGAFDGDRLVSSVTVWKIDDEVYATENIFTIPEYRSRNIAKTLIARVLEELRDSKKAKARLTVYSDNFNAVKLYLELGYHLSYNLLEINY